MSDRGYIRDCLRALAEAAPQNASPSVEQSLLVHFRKRRESKRRWTYAVGLAASIAIAAGLYLAPRHRVSPIQNVSLPDDYQTRGFIALPYAESGVPLEQPVIVRVNVLISELGMMGAPLAAATADERVSADLLVGQDGVARAVRFVQ
jgi:hypothetical protein